MVFARKVWKLLVALKDGLALLFLLLFFMLLYALLSARPNAANVQDGALLLEIDGVIVEEPSISDPLTSLISTTAPISEYRARDIVLALRTAAKDDRIKAVVLDLSSFLGGGFVHLQDIGEALDEVRAAKKPVLAYGLAYMDDGMLLAAHADEVWMNSNGGAFITGPGGNHLYFGKLLEKLKIKANVYRVGTFKSAVEPWIRNEPSDDSRKAYEAVYGAIWDAWKADFRKARPKADLDLVTTDPVGWLNASGGDVAQAGKAAGLVDRLGSKTDFNLRVTQIVGDAHGSTGLGDYAHTSLRDWLSVNTSDDGGKAIGVITVAGEIIDGDNGPGIAGGYRIESLLNDALDNDLAALVVRVDSPGGSVISSELIRAAIERHKAKKIPVVVSMANVAASGGYWVSMPAERIFAEPGTITGSIGIFAILPSFDKALADFGITGAGVKTTPLSGQPDFFTGLAPEVSPMIQASVESGYRKFIALVSTSRAVSADEAKDWAEGRPWSGSAARQLGLVDEFGGLDDALAYAAKSAKLKDGEWHAKFLGGENSDPFTALLHKLGKAKAAAGVKGLDLAGMASERQHGLVRQAQMQASRLFAARGIQAYCLECPVTPAAAQPKPDGAEAPVIMRFFSGIWPD